MNSFIRGENVVLKARLTPNKSVYHGDLFDLKLYLYDKRQRTIYI